MCGIVGVLFVDKRSPGEIQHIVTKMSLAQNYRGPDSAGAWSNHHVGLSSVRLAVTGGAVGGSQPLRDPTGGISVYNGEIYNAVELASSFGGEEHAPGFSDGRPLLALLNKHGVKGLNRARGPFSLARFDTLTGRLLLVRDAVGKKPLYLAQIDGGWAFASTIKALFEATGPLVRRDNAILEYLTYRSVGGLGTSYEGVVQVPPGSWVEIDLNGQKKEGKWWSPPRETNANLDAEQVRELLTKSILQRHEVERKTAVFLSGGLDSSIVAATLANAHPKADIQTLSIGYDVAGFEDETGYAARMASHCNLEHEQITLSAHEIPSLLDEAACLTEDPIQDPVVLPTIKLARAAVAHTKVVLTGDGSDEIWGGYSRFDNVPADLERYLERTSIFSARDLGLAQMPRSYLDDVQLPDEALAPLDRVLRLEVANRMRNYHLARIDKVCMGLGLEPRSPFLDIRAVSEGLAIPVSLKRPNDVPKGLLIEAFSSLLPPWLVERKKQPFSVPIGTWLSGDLLPFAHDVLTKHSSFISNYIDPTELLAQTRQDKPLNERTAAQVWSLLQIECWYQSFGRHLEARPSANISPLKLSTTGFG